MAKDWVVAAFEGFDDYSHFTYPQHSTCFGCNSHLLKMRPLLVTDDFMLVPATAQRDDGEFVVIPDSWIVYPREHVTAHSELPPYWTASVQAAIRHLNFTPGTSFCVSENWGSEAGQTAEHGHAWIFLRGIDEEDLVCKNVGFVTTIYKLRAGRA